MNKIVPSESSPNQSNSGRINHHLRNYARKLIRFSTVISFRIWLLLAIGTPLVGITVRDDSEKSLTFTTFNVPPSLEEQGYTGIEVARSIKDQIDAIRTWVQRQTQKKAIYEGRHDTQDDDLQLTLAIPGTDISFRQITYLISHFMGLTPEKISGSLTKDENGLHLTIRLSQHPTVVLHSREDQLSELISQAAQHILKHKQPFFNGVLLRIKTALSGCTEFS